MCLNDWSDTVGKAATRHRAGCPGIKIGEQGDAFFAIPRAFDGITALRDQLAQLGRGLRGFNLEVGDLLDLARHAHE